jgi:uncharacterized protein (DUF427 family)
MGLTLRAVAGPAAAGYGCPMALMTGLGPFGHTPAGVFNRQLPRKGLLYLEPSPRRIRGLLGDEVVVDSTHVKLLLEHGRLPRYYFPEADVRAGLLVANGRTSYSSLKGETRHFDLRLGDRVVPDGALSHPAPPPEAPLAGLVAFYWKALDSWLEEDEPAIGHARDPYHRVDAVPSSRHVRVSVDGEVLAESRRPTVIFETGMGPRWYLPRTDVRAELLPGDAHTVCAYKGHASYWSVGTSAGLRENIAWTYLEPRRDALPVAGQVAFLDEHVDLEVDGEPQPHPRTLWAAPRWWETIARFEARI